MDELIELLPLYAELQGHPKLEIVKHYARACVVHATAAKDAEIEALRAEVERMTRCLANANAGFEEFERRWYLEQDRAERLAEALREAYGQVRELCDAHVHPYPEASFARYEAALHPTTTQDGK